MSEADAIAFRTCSGIERPHLDFVEEQFKKLVLPTGPVILEKPNSALDEKWASWLGEFKQGSMVYCCLGSECRLRPNLFQELLLGLELIGMPFLVALKPPIGFDSVGRRVQREGSLSEALLNECQLVLLPNVGDQFLNARLMSKNLQVGVEVEKGEDDGLYTKESVCKAVSIVMDDENETSRIVKSNHDKIKEVLLNKD
ncbi:Glycosyltransferase [Arachis hypogaea]|nr:Glycosyltransferase [Arachis hypogaea]